MNDPRTLHPVRQFASDTYAGICPEALRALQEANQGHAPAYGDDPWTARATQLLRDLFETECEVFFVLTGTAANSLALAAVCQSYHSVICHADAHIQTDECGCPEFAAHGIKLVPVPCRGGKLTPERIQEAAAKRRDVHSNKPRVVSLSQATEVGTIYDVEEVKAICTAAHEAGLLVHVDGARFANAVATLNAQPRTVTWEAGVDVLCFGGTKNGMATGDAIIFFNRALAQDFAYRRKQAGQLLAKMRFVAAQWAGMLESATWLRNAQHANAMARTLEHGLRSVPGVEILYPVQANGVFFHMPQPWIDGLHQRGWHFYTIADGERLMCSWDTQPADITAFVSDLRASAT